MGRSLAGRQPSPGRAVFHRPSPAPGSCSGPKQRRPFPGSRAHRRGSTVGATKRAGTKPTAVTWQPISQHSKWTCLLEVISVGGTTGQRSCHRGVSRFQQLLSRSSCGTARAMLRPQWLTVDGRPSTYRMSRPTLSPGGPCRHRDDRALRRLPMAWPANLTNLLPTATADAPERLIGIVPVTGG